MASDNAPRWTTATVVGSEQVADGVRRIVLAPRAPVHARPGSHVDVRLPRTGRAGRGGPSGPGGTLTRSYSVVDSEDGGRRLTLTVQLAVPGRGGSRRMHDLRPGDELAVTLPLQNFPLGVGARRYVLVAGGIGITALVAMAESLRLRGEDYRFVIVGRSRSVLPYLPRLRERHGDRMELHVDDEGGRLDVDVLVAGIGRDGHADRTELYLCGPIGLMEAVGRSWRAAGLPGPNLRFETFGNSGSWAPEEFVLRVRGTAREVVVPPDSTALEALERAGLDVMSDCRKGECGLCVVKIRAVTGRVDHRDVFLDESEKAADEQMCLCVSRVAVPGDPAPARGVVEVGLP